MPHDGGSIEWLIAAIMGRCIRPLREAIRFAGEGAQASDVHRSRLRSFASALIGPSREWRAVQFESRVPLVFHLYRSKQTSRAERRECFGVIHWDGIPPPNGPGHQGPLRAAATDAGPSAVTVADGVV